MPQENDANSTISKFHEEITNMPFQVSIENIEIHYYHIRNYTGYLKPSNMEKIDKFNNKKINIEGNFRIPKRDEMLSLESATKISTNKDKNCNNDCVDQIVECNLMLQDDNNWNLENLSDYENEENDFLARDIILYEPILDERCHCSADDARDIITYHDRLITCPESNTHTEISKFKSEKETKVIENRNLINFKEADSDKLRNNVSIYTTIEQDNYKRISLENIRQSDRLSTMMDSESTIFRNPKLPIEGVDDADEEKSTNTVNHSMSVFYNKFLQKQLTIEENLKDWQYRHTCKIFRQHLPCFKLPDINNVYGLKGKISKCRECRTRPPQFSSNDIYCRFLDFRCLQYTENGVLRFTGFPNPYTDFTIDDRNIWQPDNDTEPTCKHMSVEISRYILMYIGDQFCYLWRQEAEALKLNENSNKPIAWKKLVKGIREICDVCETTLFNFHWTCEICGFGVCLDCYRDRKLNISIKRNALRTGCDENYWLICSSGSPHILSDLRLTQIIAGDALNVLGRKLHEIRTIWEIPQKCHCLLSTQKIMQETTKKLVNDIIKDQELKDRLEISEKINLMDKRTMDLNNFHRHKIQFADSIGLHFASGHKFKIESSFQDSLISVSKDLSQEHLDANYLQFLPAQIMSLQRSMLLAPDIPHEWLCDGKLLRLLDPRNSNNRILFQEVWKRGQPVIISEVSKSLTLDLWHPQTFLRDFGDKPNDLINCLTGNLVPNQPMRHFWEGFLSVHKRLIDGNGDPMLLKLKDWPPGDDFAEILPKRFDDLMKGLPMPEYTLRDGQLNISSCLPKMFVPPDLGPKMYNAYGSALYPKKGTTNLHLDISDAVNIMVYVGVPYDDEITQQHEASQIAITKGGCEYLTRARIARKDIIPGALWHIFHAKDADKIRDFLKRETLQKGFRLEADHDPIHDQNWYLDENLRKKLFQEYGVEGYPIVQCLGDAVFIPAGAPHQVQNLYNCIKVAEDFVSPENISHCFYLTQQFRRLSHCHTNHEDKLQIKNIIYHAVKDCCTILNRVSSKRCTSRDEFK